MSQVSARIEKIRPVKGTRDLLPAETWRWQKVEDEARRVFGAYNFREIRTPVLEHTELFARSVGVDTDIVTKEMYTFQDRPTGRELQESSAELARELRTANDPKPRYPLGTRLEIPGGALITLRPEATASVVRAYIEHSLFNEGGVQKLYYMGPMFRRERPQKGRYRQFSQIGAEVLGSDTPGVDAEVLEMLVLFLERLGIHDFTLLLNSVGCPICRPEYLKKLKHALQGVKATMCEDCQRRADANPLRVFDCKVEADQPVIAKLPHMLDHLCPECHQHFESVKGELEQRAIRFQIEPRLVRGLDYYTRTTFEISHGALGAQNALLGGGRYDGLSEMLGGPPTPGIGFAIGQDRLVLAVEQAGHIKPEPLGAFIAWMTHEGLVPAATLARDLRRQNISAELLYSAVKMKKSLGMASKMNARFAVIIGENELASGLYQVKDMRTGEQEAMSPAQIPAHLKVKLEK